MDLVKKIRVDYPDHDVCQRVRNFLCTRHFPAFRSLVVEVNNGVVTLTGRVKSYYEKQVALSVCQHVPGVLSIVDGISVKEHEPIREVRLSPARKAESTRSTAS